MIRECFKTETGIMFNSEALRVSGLDPASLYPHVLPRPPPLSVTSEHTIQPILSTKVKKSQPSPDVENLAQLTKLEEEHELLDALSPIYDQLSIKRGWWVLELLPVKQRFQKSNNTWATHLRMNLGSGRFIPRQKKKVIKVHRSVKLRMDAQYADGKKYKPKASFAVALEHGNVQWVD